MTLLAQGQPYYLFAPLFSAAVFAMASLAFKRSFREGAGVTRVFFVNHLLLGLSFLPFAAFESKAVPWERLYQPALVAMCFFVGNIANFVAIRTGDVSLVAPLLGTKTVFVALFSWLVFAVPLTFAHGAAALLATIAIFLLGLTEVRPGARVARTTLLALASSLLFGFCDAMLGAWVKEFGVLSFLAIQFTLTALASFSVVPFFRGPLWAMPAPAWRWLLLGSGLITVQAAVLVLAIAWSGDATGVNVVYGTRGLWSVVFVWFAGGWFGNTERADARGSVFLWRAVGAALMVAAVALTVQAVR